MSEMCCWQSKAMPPTQHPVEPSQWSRKVLLTCVVARKLEPLSRCFQVECRNVKRESGVEKHETKKWSGETN